MAHIIRALSISVLLIGYYAALAALASQAGLHMTPAATVLLGSATILAILFVARQLSPAQRAQLTIGALTVRALDHIFGARS